MLINKITSKIKYIDFYFSESTNQFNECIEFVDLGCSPQRGSMYRSAI